MGINDRIVRGAEAGAIAAAAVELSFFLLDLIRLQPLATPFTLSGVAPGPAGVVLDLTSVTGVMGVLWAIYQVVTLTLIHFLAFGLAGILSALLFDWTQPAGVGRVGVVTLLCTAAFLGTVATSSSLVALGSVGVVWVIGMNVLAALVLGGGLRMVSNSPPDHESPT